MANELAAPVGLALPNSDQKNYAFLGVGDEYHSLAANGSQFANIASMKGVLA
jgi:hypothetical protein